MANHLMTTDLVSELGWELARGNVALWLGPEWKMPTRAEHIASVTSRDWLGVWTESQSGAFADALARAFTERAGLQSRVVLEVPDYVEDVLGRQFSFQSICPVMYLDGLAGGWARFKKFERIKARSDKLDELKGLGPCTLVIVGHSDPHNLAELISEEILPAAQDLRVLVTGLPESQWQLLLADIGPTLASRHVRVDARPLLDILVEVDRRREAAAGFVEPEIQVGDISVPLKSVLRTTPPIDQDFQILTRKDTRLPEPDEEHGALLKELLSGGPDPWRAFAHRLEWQRSVDHFDAVMSRLGASGDKPPVSMLTIEAEGGSGLTTLLKRIAFEAARRGYPTLVHRSERNVFNYDLLRAFLTDLRQAASQEKAVPAMLVFDSTFHERDPLDMLSELPRRLTKDGLHAVVLAGSPVRTQSPGSKPGRLGGILAPSLKSELTATEQTTLADWANTQSKREHFDPDGLSAIANWQSQGHDGVPLLICLYFILQGELRTAAQLGSHLVDRFHRIVPSAPTAPADRTTKALSPEDIRQAVAKLNAAFREGKRFDEQPSRAEFCAAFLALAVLGSLKIAAPRDILSDVLDISHDRLASILSQLDRIDLVTTDLPFSEFPEPDGRETLGPAAFYTSRETVGLRHTAYGRLILEFLVSAPGFGSSLQGNALGSALLSTLITVVATERALPEYPIQLLEPILRALRPVRSHVEFAEQVATSYLRLQREPSDTVRFKLAEFQWRHTPLLSGAYTWFDPQLVDQSDVILHSRGMLYKTAAWKPLPEARHIYEAAEKDLSAAVRRATEPTGHENPANARTSLGLLYLGWADRERQEGNVAEARALDLKARQTLEDALALRRSNPYATYGLARFYIGRCKRALQPTAHGSDSGAHDLTRALELLQAEPEETFRSQWEQLKVEAVGLLDSDRGRALIEALKKSGDRLGFALEALRLLGGTIPTQADVTLAPRLSTALQILEDSEAGSAAACPLADLLTYAVFSALPERDKDPAYRKRFELINSISGTHYFEEPVWMFDFAMLAFQVGQFRTGEEAFGRLRKERKFFEVPLERAVPLVTSPDSTLPMAVPLTITTSMQGEQTGWGRVKFLKDPVPFSTRDFVSRGMQTKPGSVEICHIRLRPAGPFAIPRR